MFIFAIFSIPITFLLLIEKKNSKNLVLFFFGCVISSIFSLLFWAISTLYAFDSDSLLNKSIIYFICNTIPLLILFLMVTYSFFSSNKKIDLSFSFISGFLYFNLLFSIFTNPRYSVDLLTLYSPVFYIFSIYCINKLNRVEFKNENRLFKSLSYIFIPLFILLSFVFFQISIILSIIFFVLSFFSIVVFKLDLWSIKSRIIHE
jgi:hypothetical protein